MHTNFKRPFARYVKKAGRPLQLAIEDEVQIVTLKPEIGELKVGDLSGIRVHKFRFQQQQYLMAYQIIQGDGRKKLGRLDFYQVGSHENFYERLKTYLRQNNPTGERT